jgi:hypothetical protein
MQNFAPGRFDAPHDGQPTGIGAPHLSQKRLPPGRSTLQLGHSMPHLTFREHQRSTEANDVMPSNRASLIKSGFNCEWLKRDSDMYV